MSIIGSLPYNLTNGTTADATQVMADFNAIVNGVNSATTGAAPIPTVQSNGYNYAADTGTVNNLVIGVSPSPASYTDGLRMYGKAANTNTSTTVTVTFGSLTSVAVVIDQAGTLPPIGSIIAGMHYALEYDSTQGKAILVNPSRATGAIPLVLSGMSAGGTGNLSYDVSPDGHTLTIWTSLSAITGTSNAATMGGSGIPASLQTAITQNFNAVSLEDNGGNVGTGLLSIGASGVWTFGKVAPTAGGFTTTGVKGLGNGFFAVTKL